MGLFRLGAPKRVDILEASKRLEGTLPPMMTLIARDAINTNLLYLWENFMYVELTRYSNSKPDRSLDKVNFPLFAIEFARREMSAKAPRGSALVKCWNARLWEVEEGLGGPGWLRDFEFSIPGTPTSQIDDYVVNRLSDEDSFALFRSRYSEEIKFDGKTMDEWGTPFIRSLWHYACWLVAFRRIRQAHPKAELYFQL